MTRASDASIYDDDFFAWTQEQAAALRRLPADVSSNVDVLHVAEEIEDLGKRDLREVMSLLGRLIEHLMKIDNANTAAPNVPHWRSEARLFAMGARDAFSPSMRRAMDVDLLWRKTRKRVARDMAEAGAGFSAPASSPFTLDEMLAEDLDLDLLLAKLKSADR